MGAKLFLHVRICDAHFNSWVCFAVVLVETMPNKKQMVKEIPEMKLGSSDWYNTLPIGIAACCIYNCTFVALVVRAVWVAPKHASIKAGFTVRYRFAFGAFRPDRWWFATIRLAFGLSLNLVQAILPTPHQQLYVTSCMIIMLTMVQYELQPFKFIDANRMDLYFKLAFVVFLIVATSFVNIGDMDDTMATNIRGGYDTLRFCAVFGYLIGSLLHIPLGNAFVFPRRLCTWQSGKNSCPVSRRHGSSSVDVRQSDSQNCCRELRIGPQPNTGRH